ncbi:MAG: maleylpyruvate isomerase family mycothiol-dependent enzyme, partial [Acidimicrobiales bacterium]
MQLNPRYGTDPLITLDGSPAEILEPAVRQRRRLAATLATLTDEQWAHPSRCDGWSSRDVIVHLDTTNSFWAFSIAQGLKGEPTQFLATFDPVTSPAQMVADAGDVSVDKVLNSFLASTDALTDLLTSLDTGDWTVLAESPPGHVSISALTHHALWDSWVHERDILLPLGLPADEEPDEIIACLRYGAALAPAFAVTNGAAASGVLAVSVDDPDAAFVVTVDGQVDVRVGRSDDADLELTGPAVEVLETLSIRRPIGQTIDPG